MARSLFRPFKSSARERKLETLVRELGTVADSACRRTLATLDDLERLAALVPDDRLQATDRENLQAIPRARVFTEEALKTVQQALDAVRTKGH